MHKAFNFRNSLAARLALVLLAFLLMIASSCITMYYALNQKLLQSAESTMDDTKLYFSRIILEPKAILNLIANNIEGIYNRGEGIDAVKRYIDEASAEEFKDRLSGLNYYSVYIYFEHSGEFHEGLGWVPGDDYNPKERPWYTVAVEAGGEATMSELYIDMNTQLPIVSYSRQVLNESGEPFGVVCIDVLIEYLRDLVVSKHITENSYGFMADENLRIIMHPNTGIEGELLADSNPDMLRFRDDINDGVDISLERTVNYEGMPSVIFGRRLDNGWYFTLLVPESEYYGELNDMVVITGLLGTALASILILMLVGIEKARKKADEEHRIKMVQLAEAEGATRAKSSFLAQMSHEIRTPMNAILGITEIQLQKDSLDPDIRAALDKIYSAGDLLLSIINDILDLSKIEAGKLELVCVNYDVAGLISDTVQLNIMRIGSKPIEFKLFIGEDTPALVHGDEMRVKQILNNILSNAFKYTLEGTVTLAVGTEAVEGGEPGDGENSQKDGLLLVFSITDTGQGMTEEQVAGLFSEYTRFNMENNRTTEGTGLGLSITRNLVELMGGDISVKSEPGKGSIFTVRILQGKAGTDVLSADTIQRLCQFQGTESSGRMKRAAIVREPMPYGNVLVVDDVETNIYVASGLMLPYGLEIDSADSGQAAISKIQDGKVYDIVFMDHMMPVMDGVEAVGRIRAMGYTEPIIALTANAVAGQADMFLESGFDDYISKPIDVRQLNAVLNKWIRDKQPPEVLEAARQLVVAKHIHGGDEAEAEQDGSMSLLHTDSRIAEAFARDVVKSILMLEMITAEQGEYSEEELRNYVINVHGLKSALANVGQYELSERARKLEMAGREGNAEMISAETSGFLHDLQALLEEITLKKQERKTIELSKSDMGFLHEKLLAVKAACEELDENAAESAIEQLRQIELPQAAWKVLEDISEYLLHSDFDEAANAAKQYATSLPLGGGSAPGGQAEPRSISVEIPGVDVRKGLETFEFNEEVYAKVLRSFVDSGHKLLDEMQTFREDRLADYRIQVHGIKGMCYDIFADKLAAAAKRMEAAADAGDLKYIGENSPAFLEDMKALVRDVENALLSMDGRIEKPKKDVPDAEALSKLLDACDSFSMDKVDAAMREIEEYEYENDDGLVTWLRDKIAMLEFNEVAGRLRDMA